MNCQEYKLPGYGWSLFGSIFRVVCWATAFSPTHAGSLNLFPPLAPDLYLTAYIKLYLSPCWQYRKIVNGQNHCLISPSKAVFGDFFVGPLWMQCFGCHVLQTCLASAICPFVQPPIYLLTLPITTGCPTVSVSTLIAHISVQSCSIRKPF